MARIIYIENDKEFRENVVDLLTLEGFSVDAFGRGDEGLQSIIETRPDLVMSDVDLPGIDGFELLQELSHAKGRLSELPVIVYTGSIDEEMEEKAYELGARCVVHKPYDTKKLVNLIRRNMSYISLIHHH